MSDIQQAADTKFFIPFILEDKTGRLSGSDFVDLHGRLKLLYRRKVEVGDDTRRVYNIYNTTPGRMNPDDPVAELEFRTDRTLGTIRFAAGEPVPMASYLQRVSGLSGPVVRSFVGSDGNEYRWGYSIVQEGEITCINSSGAVVGAYSLKNPGEPPYQTSGCALMIDEGFPHLACELLATSIIMRHIVEYNLEV